MHTARLRNCQTESLYQVYILTRMAVSLHLLFPSSIIIIIFAVVTILAIKQWQEKWFAIAVLICIFLMSSDVENIFIFVSYLVILGEISADLQMFFPIPIKSCLFILWGASFVAQKSSILMKSSLTLFCFVECGFGICVNIYYQTQDHGDLYLCLLL